MCNKNCIKNISGGLAMIIGQIFKGVKRMIEFKLYAAEDRRDLAEVQNNLICRLTTAAEEAGDNMIRAIKQIDRILN